MGKKIYYLFGIILILFVACTQQPTGNKMNLTVLESDIIKIDTAEPEDEPLYQPIDEQREQDNAEQDASEQDTMGETNQGAPATSVEIPPEYEDIAIRKIVTEGELVELNPQAVDYDGDDIIYSFTAPLDETGEWKTVEGDAGFYPITVSASDGKDTTTETILLVVKSANKAPQLVCPDEIRLQEGEELVIDCTAEDPEGDNVIMEYSGWVTSRIKQTGYQDEGTHTVTVKATDGKRSSEEMINVIVEDKNRAPVIKKLENMNVIEGGLVRVVPEVSDPDNDDLTIAFTQPLDQNGEWQTEVGDAGQYTTEVSASDGKTITKQNVLITVAQMNQAPVLNEIEDITVEEGQTIRLPIAASDPDGDRIEVSISGWMTSDEYTTTYTDAGVHTVTVTASDGQLETSQDITITVQDKNRPPVFRVPV